jgi:hypothetical protein
LIKRFDRILHRTKKEEKEVSPAPSSESVDSLKNKKNLINMMSKPVKTRDIGILCKIDDDLEYQKILSTKKMTLKSDRPIKSARKIYSENLDARREAATIKAAERRASKRMEEEQLYENVRKTTRPGPIRVEIDLRRASKYDSDGNESSKPVGIASPQVQRPSITSVTSIESRRLNSQQKYQISKPIRVELDKPSPAPRSQLKIQDSQFADRNAPEKMSFREYRESLRANRGEKNYGDPDSDLKKTHQQSFFVPF